MLHLFAGQQYRAGESTDPNFFEIQHDEANRDARENFIRL